MKLKPIELRKAQKDEKKIKKVKRNPIYIVLDNVMDTYNIGAIFRLADAVAAEKVMLCGEAETPPNSRIKKSSINTTEWIAWEYFSTTSEAIKDLKSKIENIHIVAIEQAKGSVPYTEVQYQFPIALVVGHETHGVSKDVLKLCDKIVELPMFGVNVSLNVMVSLGIVLYKIIESYNFSSPT